MHKSVDSEGDQYKIASLNIFILLCFIYNVSSSINLPN